MLSLSHQYRIVAHGLSTLVLPCKRITAVRLIPDAGRYERNGWAVMTRPGPRHAAETDPAQRHAARSAEHARLAESPRASDPWRLWGPYLAGRQWGTVREDYSVDGD